MEVRDDAGEKLDELIPRNKNTKVIEELISVNYRTVPAISDGFDYVVDEAAVLSLINVDQGLVPGVID